MRCSAMRQGWNDPSQEQKRAKRGYNEPLHVSLHQNDCGWASAPAHGVRRQGAGRDDDRQKVRHPGSAGPAVPCCGCAAKRKNVVRR